MPDIPVVRRQWAHLQPLKRGRHRSDMAGMAVGYHTGMKVELDSDRVGGCHLVCRAAPHMVDLRRLDISFESHLDSDSDSGNCQETVFHLCFRS